MSEAGVTRESLSGESSSAIDRPSGRRRSDRVVGAARATQEAVDQAMAVARAERPLLIVGPSGAGKEHLARAVHAWSARAAGPFVVVACAAVSPVLLGREFFGCSEAAHPKLPEEYPGALARAAGGTVLVQGMEGVPDPLREQLIKAIGDSRYSREGDGAAVTLRTRVIATAAAASNPPLFGELPHHAIGLLPLSERREDILPLAAHFLRLAADEEGVETVGFTSDARSALMGEEWKGNVRELAERVRQALRLAGKGAISAEALLLSTDGEEVPSFKEAKRAFETRYVRGLLRRCGGNISRAARLAKKDRKDFYDVIRRTGIDPAEFR
jgi:two-component system response regulator GlrR